MKYLPTIAALALAAVIMFLSLWLPLYFAKPAPTIHWPEIVPKVDPQEIPDHPRDPRIPKAVPKESPKVEPRISLPKIFKRPIAKRQEALKKRRPIRWREISRAECEAREAKGLVCRRVR